MAREFRASFVERRERRRRTDGTGKGNRDRAERRSAAARMAPRDYEAEKGGGNNGEVEGNRGGMGGNESWGGNGALWGSVGRCGAARCDGRLSPPLPREGEALPAGFLPPRGQRQGVPVPRAAGGDPATPCIPPVSPSPPAPHPPRPPLLFLLPRSLPRVSGLPVAPQRFAAPRLFPRPPRPCWLTGSCAPSGFPYRTWRRRTRRWRRRWWKTCGATSSCSAAPCRSCCPASSADRWGSSTGTPFTSTPHHQPTPSPPTLTPLPTYKIL